MSFDSLIAILGLLAAIYAIMPRARQLDLHLRIRKRDCVAVIAGLLAIHYLLFFPVLSPLGLSPRLGLYRWNITPSLVAYLIALLVIAFVASNFGRFRLTKSKLPAFQKLVGELSTGEGYTDLFSLLEHHIDALKAITRPAHPISDNQNQEATLDLCDVLIREDTVQQLVIRRPYLGIELLKLDQLRNNGFNELYFRYLVETPNSPWYLELKNNTNVSHHTNYSINPENRLIHSLLSDAHVAKELRVYRPIGNRAIQELRVRGRLQADDYNQAMDDFFEEGRWQSPLWTTIFFFDIMTSAALWQGIRWHMWLYYYPYFAKAIISNYSLDQDRFVNRESEWPTKYSFLLYQMVTNLRNWIQEIEHIPLDQPNVSLDNESLELENDNIPKSAILALGQVLRYTTISDALPQSFRNYLLEIAFSLYFDLMMKSELRPYAKVLAASLANGGTDMPSSDKNILLARIREAFSSFDSLPYRLRQKAAVSEFDKYLADELPNRVL